VLSKGENCVSSDGNSLGHRVIMVKSKIET
jgi:hypothetical protein